MVYFVGAGPGAPDLITVRGYKLISQADVIIYAGSLVNPELLQAAKPACEIFNSAFMTLEEVIAVMEDAEQRGLLCVRLHTGDPSIYGAIREQMDLLEERGIVYETCPGVSAMFGAAAALNLEYTRPGVSQTVIVSRSAGCTPVPDRESIRKLAVHQSTMVLFLSAGQARTVSQELIGGGYSPDTPAAIVYKATWPEEKTIRCTIGSLPAAAAQNNITKTALIIVGDVLEGKAIRSKLYDPSYATEFRPAVQTEREKGAAEQAAVIAFTREGTRLASRIVSWLREEGWQCDGYSTQKDMPDMVEIKLLSGSLREWTEARFADSRALLFVGAAGIAVRAAAPFIRDKMTDPAVLVIDEAGRHVIPVLSGHVGGANRLAESLADFLGAECVLTTATDVRGRFAVDRFAVDNHLLITDRDKAKGISADILQDKHIGICCPAGWLQAEDLPNQLAECDDPEESRILIDWHSRENGERALRLIPEKAVWIGIGCKKETTEESLQSAFADFLQAQRLDRDAVAGFASISLKSEEKGLLAFAGSQKEKILFYTAEQLGSLTGSFSESCFVMQQTGTGNVCERAACLAALENGVFTGQSEAENSSCLIIRKTKYKGITFAAALADRRLMFE